jgi:hypothetical protein
MTDLTDRVRLHEAPHIRHIDVQTLDALLRIEELLVNLNEALAGPRVAMVKPELTLNDSHTSAELKVAVGKNKKNARQL